MSLPLCALRRRSISNRHIAIAGRNGDVKMA
jgi:hypothetical protein